MPDSKDIESKGQASSSYDVAPKRHAKNRFSRASLSQGNSAKVIRKKRAQKASSATSSEGADDTDGARKGMLFLAGVLLVYVLYLFVTGQIEQFVAALRNVDSGWIIGACICYLFYFIFGVGAYVIAVWLDPDSPVGIRDLMSVEASGVFFGNLTPMMAGSIPAQIYRLTRTGLDPGEATATQFTRFIMFQFGVVFFAAIMLVLKFQFFLESYGNIVYLNLIVFGVHFLELLALFVVCLCPHFVMKIGNWGIKFASKHGWLKDYSHWYDVVNNQVIEFSDAFKRAMRHLPSMGLTLVVTMLQLASLYMIPWFVLNAFGQSGDFLNCLAAGSMVQMVATAVPLPGGTGGAEGGFALFYGPLFGKSATAGYLIWRLITFFGPTLLAAPMLGLRSTSTESIYQRWNNFAHGAGQHRETYMVRARARAAARNARHTAAASSTTRNSRSSTHHHDDRSKIA